MLTVDAEKEPLIGFACGHVYHLSCLLAMRSSGDSDSDTSAALAKRLAAQYASEDEGGAYSSRSVGAKVAHAHIIGNAIRGRCPVCGKDDE
jgi:vacuolar protein sorting-associated protein 41